jgi:hypothetical protein
MGHDYGTFATRAMKLPGSGHAVLGRSVADTRGSKLARPQGWLPLCGTPDNVQEPLVRPGTREGVIGNSLHRNPLAAQVVH